jgi:beta-phosphoglucomutase
MSIEAVIFDLDGVIVSTDDFHYLGWKQLADNEGIYFDRERNERCRGVSRMESLEVVLELAEKNYTEEEKQEMATRKNNYYRELLNTLTPGHILPGVLPLLEELKARGIKIAIGSSSRNSPAILEHIGLKGYFDAEADGNHITQSKPDPEVFLLAAERCGVAPENCLVVEDAEAGVSAALNAGMKCLGVGAAASDARAHLRAESLEGIPAEQLLSV